MYVYTAAGDKVTLNLDFLSAAVNAVSLGKSGVAELMFKVIGPYSKKNTTLMKYVGLCLSTRLKSEINTPPACAK